MCFFGVFCEFPVDKFLQNAKMFIVEISARLGEIQPDLFGVCLKIIFSGCGLVLQKAVFKHALDRADCMIRGES